MPFIFFALLLFFAVPAHAEEPSAQVYHTAIGMAAQGKTAEAVAALQAASAMLPAQNMWQQRMITAAMLLQMKQQQLHSLPALASNSNLLLADAYIRTHPATSPHNPWFAGSLGTLFPGAGHAWLGRWHDARMAAILVIPMLLLTLWAARRQMGPVTLFFAAITLWLWSGTIFSAISLSQRENMEAYMQWWQPMWQAAALSGQPW